MSWIEPVSWAVPAAPAWAWALLQLLLRLVKMLGDMLEHLSIDVFEELNEVMAFVWALPA